MTDPWIAAAERVEADLRQEWWMNHGHPFHALYGDDGEMQCGKCSVDFKRLPIDELRERVQQARLAAFDAAQDTPKGEDGYTHDQHGAHRSHRRRRTTGEQR